MAKKPKPGRDPFVFAFQKGPTPEQMEQRREQKREIRSFKTHHQQLVTRRNALRKARNKLVNGEDTAAIDAEIIEVARNLLWLEREAKGSEEQQEIRVLRAFVRRARKAMGDALVDGWMKDARESVEARTIPSLVGAAIAPNASYKGSRQ